MTTASVVDEQSSTEQPMTACISKINLAVKGGEAVDVVQAWSESSVMSGRNV